MSEELTKEKVDQFLKEEQERKLQAFRLEYDALCKKHGCSVVGVPGITGDGRIGVQLRVRVG